MAQLVRAPPCHGGGRGFESLPGRFYLIWDHSSAGRASALQAEGHRFEPYWSHSLLQAGVAELADAQDLKSCRSNTVPVRFRSPAFVRKYKPINVSVAQLDRALGYGPRCREFESSHSRFKEPLKQKCFEGFLFSIIYCLYYFF